MADIARTVDDIRGFLFSYDQVLNPHLPDLARDYADACIEANKRLAKCQRLLQQGLRAEAIHLAMEAPDLLDAIRVLDFAERASWLEIVKQYNLHFPPEFDATAIEFLQSAYVDDNPLRELMRNHRRLALQRAPLKQRIAILRELIEKDANNPIWGTDVQIFEIARIEQIKDEAAESKRNQDVASLGILNGELSSKAWLIPPPKTLVRSVAQAVADFRQHQTRQDQTEMVWALQEAFAALNVHKARELRTRWQQLDGRSNGKTSNPLYGQVERVFHWLEEIDRQEEEEKLYSQALTDLGDGLDDRLPQADVEQLGEDVLRFGRGMPKDLEARYRSRLDGMTLTSSRKRQLLIVCLIAAVVFVTILTLVISWQWSQAVAAESAAEKIDKGLAADRLIETRAYVDNLTKSRPFLSRYPVVTAAKSRLIAAEVTEGERAARFDRMLLQVDEAPLAPTESSLLTLVRSQAHTDAEKRRAEEVTERRRVAYNNRVARSDELVRPKLQTLSTRMAEMKRQLIDPAADDLLRNMLREVRADIHTISAQSETASEEVRTLFQSVSSCSDEIKEELELRNIRRNLEQEITRATIRSPTLADNFSASLTGAAKVFPESRASDFRKVIGEKGCWSGALAWADISYGWQLASADSEKPTVANARAAQCVSLLAGYSDFPGRDLLQEAHTHYEAVAHRAEVVKRLDDLFADYFIDEIYVTTVRESQGDFLYYSKKPVNPKTRELRVLDGFNENESHSLYPIESNVVFATKAPQSFLGAQLRATLLKNSSLEGWNSMMVNFASQVSVHNGTDPLLKLSILQSLLPIAIEGSRELGRSCEPTLKTLEPARALSNVRWMNPKDTAANEARAKATRILETLPSWANLKRATDQAQLEFADKIEAIPQPIGWLVKELNWTCRMAITSRLPTSGKLCVSVPGTPRSVWKTVGQIKDGRVLISPEDRETEVEGRLVFLRVEPTTKKVVSDR
jgi:hypothetical protein